jgi:hypothetical protein
VPPPSTRRAKYHVPTRNVVIVILRWSLKSEWRSFGHQGCTRDASTRRRWARHSGVREAFLVNPPTMSRGVLPYYTHTHQGCTTLPATRTSVFLLEHLVGHPVGDVLHCRGVTAECCPVECCVFILPPHHMHEGRYTNTYRDAHLTSLQTWRGHSRQKN